MKRGWIVKLINNVIGSQHKWPIIGSLFTFLLMVVRSFVHLFTTIFFFVAFKEEWVNKPYTSQPIRNCIYIHKCEPIRTRIHIHVSRSAGSVAATGETEQKNCKSHFLGQCTVKCANSKWGIDRSENINRERVSEWMSERASTQRTIN